MTDDTQAALLTERDDWREYGLKAARSYGQAMDEKAALLAELTAARTALHDLQARIRDLVGFGRAQTGPDGRRYIPVAEVERLLTVKGDGDE